VDNEEARRRLPERHAQALRLRDQGLTEESIAGVLGIPLAAVRPLLKIAEAKLARLLTEEPAEPNRP
jgi:DNA-directed RNA polymerase specialized sigma24 family protein